MTDTIGKERQERAARDILAGNGVSSNIAWEEPEGVLTEVYLKLSRLAPLPMENMAVFAQYEFEAPEIATMLEEVFDIGNYLVRYLELGQRDDSLDVDPEGPIRTIDKGISIMQDALARLELLKTEKKT